MPDPDKMTVSATQVSALFDASPYVTRWLLWRNFRHGDPIGVTPNERMDWGKRLEPAIFAATCEELNLDGEWHPQHQYLRSEAHPLGCTPDGTIHDLNRGPGAVECKNVDWLRWRDTWTEDHAPDHIEMQIQTQMLVRGQRWGIIACLVGGNELRLYHREPDADLHRRIVAAAAEFLDSVNRGDEPDPLGRADEMPLFRQSLDLGADLPPLDLRESRDACDLLAELRYWTDQEKLARTARGERMSKLELLAGEHSTVMAHGWRAYIKRSQTRPSEVSLPAELRGALAAILDAGEWNAETESALRQCIAWSQTTRRGGVRVTVDIKEAEDEGDAPWLGDDLEFTP